MDRLSASLYLDQNMRITGGIDLLSASKAGRRSLDAVMTALGGETTLHKSNMVALFKQEETIRTSSRDVALQAWSACRAANLSSLTIILSKIPIIDTLSMEEQVCFFFL
jgi:regulator of nonsense transcripts 1